MNVTLYTINDTESDFCKQAKDFLNAHNIPFENKDVEHDRTALSEMLAVSDNFSGVPVMVVGEGDNKHVVKGFTQQEFEQALGLSVQPEAVVEAPVMQNSAPVSEPMSTGEEKMDQNIAQVDQNAGMSGAAPVMPPVDPVVPVVADEPVAPATPAAPAWNNEPATTSKPVEPLVVPEPAAPVVPLTPPADATHDDELKGIMDTLSQNGMTSEPVALAGEPAPALEIPVDDHPVNPVMDISDAESQKSESVAAPAEFAPSAPVAQEPVTPSVTEPSTWANQPASATQQPVSAPAEPAAPVADMPSVPDFPQK